MGHSNCVLLHSSTLRWFENLKFIFSGASRSKSLNTQEVSAGLTFQADRSQCFLASISGQVSRAACCSTSAASGSRPPAARPRAGPATQSRPPPSAAATRSASTSWTGCCSRKSRAAPRPVSTARTWAAARASAGLETMQYYATVSEEGDDLDNIQ